jgi:hypothetical protein
MSDFPDLPAAANGANSQARDATPGDLTGPQIELLRLFDRLPAQDQVEMLALGRSKLQLREIYGSAGPATSPNG